jgi:hypothetical protein
MKIIGFGDSFIMPYVNEYAYPNRVAKYFGGTATTYGYPGSGTWDAFYQFKKIKIDADVVMFAWSGSNRLYNPDVRNICYGSSLRQRDMTNPIWEAAYWYYKYLHNFEKTNQELVCFYYWFDGWLLENYPNTKFIHMWSFPEKADGDYYPTIKSNINKLSYYHRWKNSVEIRPTLLHFSMLDGWPEDNNTWADNRLHHMTPPNHTLLAEIIIRAIENYEPGKIFGLQ